MKRLDYAKRKAWVHMLSPQEIQDKIMSIPNTEYRAVIALAFLTMSRISEICVLKKKDGQVITLTEVDNRKRKSISKYVRAYTGINPHLFRHARYNICSYVYGFTENLLQSAGAWTRAESMRDYKRYAIPEEIAFAIMRSKHD